MSLSRLDRKRADRLAQILEPTVPHPRRHRRTNVDDDVRPLVGVVRKLTDVPTQPGPESEFTASLRSFLVATAERDLAHGAAPAGSLDADTSAWQAVRPRTDALTGRTQPVRVVNTRGTGRTRIAILAGVAAGAIVLSGVSAASTGALPGDPLYSVKRSTERAQLAFAGSDASRGRLYLEFARNRMHEAAATLPPAATNALLADMNAESIQGVAFMTTAAVAGDNSALDAVNAFAASQNKDLLGLRLPSTATSETRSVLGKIESRVDQLRTALTNHCALKGIDPYGPIPPEKC